MGGGTRIARLHHASLVLNNTATCLLIMPPCILTDTFNVTNCGIKAQQQQSTDWASGHQGWHLLTLLSFDVLWKHRNVSNKIELYVCVRTYRPTSAWTLTTQGYLGPVKQYVDFYISAISAWTLTATPGLPGT
jgi:hypothetical protein